MLGHELRHLKQPGYQIDKPPTDAEEHQRYEYDADMSALDAMDRAGYNPKAGIEMLEVFLQAGGNERDLVYHYMQKTHPVTENRVKELWREYARPDRPFFSTEKPFDPLPPEVLAEAEQLTRKERLQDIGAVRSLADWHSLLQRVEADPGVSMKDTELVGRELKRQLDVRVSIAGAIEDIEQEVGLAKAILCKANYLFEEIKKGGMIGTPWEDISNNLLIRGRYGQQEMTKFIGDILKQESPAELQREFDERQRWSDDEERVVKFIAEHEVGNDIIVEPRFSSLKELLDPTNDDAISFWLRVLANTGFVASPSPLYEALNLQGEDSARLRTPSLREELIKTAYRGAVCALSMGIYYGVRMNKSYTGKQREEKQLFLSALKEFEQQTVAQSGQAEEPHIDTSSIGFNKPDLSALKRLVEQRVSGYREQTTTGASYGNRYPLSDAYGLTVDLLQSPQRLPDAAFSAEQAVDTGELTPLQTVLHHYFRFARKIWAQELATEQLRERFQVDIDKDGFSEQLLFDAIVVDHFFDTPYRGERVRQLTIEDVRSMPELVDDLRFLPSFVWERDVEQRSERGFEYHLFLQAYLGDAATEETAEQIVKKLERVRLIQHHPALRSLYAQGGFSTNDHLLAEAVENGREAFNIKRRLFTKYLKLGQKELASEYGALSDKRLARAEKQALVNRARSAGLPDDFFWMRGPEQTFLAKARGWFGDESSAKQDKNQRAALDAIFSQEFMRLMADDAEEMKRCHEETIRL